MSRRVRAIALPSHNHTHLSVARALGAIAMTAALTFVGGCSRSRDISEPDYARPIAAEAKPSLTLTGSAVWNGRTVAIESRQRNSAGQTLCLDVPGGNAVAGQTINYYPCHYGPNQQFVLTTWDAGFGESFAVVKPVSNSAVCFDIRGGTTNGGERLQLFTCKRLNSADANNQIFMLPAANSASATGVALISTICVQNGYPNMVLDVPLPTGVSGAMQQYRLNHGDNQLWRFKDIQAGQYFVSPDGNAWNKC